MEIYSQTFDTIAQFEGPANTSVTATASLNGGTPITIPVTNESANQSVKVINLPMVNGEGVITVNWTFMSDTFNGTQSVTVSRKYEVVTPILSKEEILEIHPNGSDEEIIAIEKATRHMVNAFTGQTFGNYIGVKRVNGIGSKLLLPARLYELSSINGIDNKFGYFKVVDDGYTILIPNSCVPGVKSDFNGVNNITLMNAPISYSNTNFSGSYDIDGKWGWEFVPSAIQEAAKLLINDYACEDATYRDRYLTSMTAADWRIQFNNRAFDGTGNARADKLLTPFILQRAAVI